MINFLENALAVFLALLIFLVGMTGLIIIIGLFVKYVTFPLIQYFLI